MKQLWIYFKKVRKELLVLLICSIATYFGIELWLTNYPEVFRGANRVGQFFSKLCISYISSFIFYFIVVHIKAEKDKQNINEFVGHEVYQIVVAGHLLINPLMEKLGQKGSLKYLSRGALSSLLQSIDRTANEAPLIFKGNTVNWIQWYDYLKNSTQEHIDKVLDRYAHLDSALIKILSRIENSLFFAQFNLLYEINHDKTFSCYQIQIEAYMNHIEELENYANKHFKKFQYMTSEFIGYKN